MKWTDKLRKIKTEKIEVNELTIYPAAEDLGTTELSGIGTDRYLAESSQANANEAAGEAAPAWTEDFDLEQLGTIAVISIYADLRWAQKITGAGTSNVKMQISGDGGVTWVDMTDNVTEAGVAYTDKQRTGPGLWISTITAGANKLKLRLCQWTDATSTEVKLREDSYVKIMYRKS